MRHALQRLLAWLRAHRRALLWIGALALFFYLLGYFAPRSSVPGMCLIYG